MPEATSITITPGSILTLITESQVLTLRVEFIRPRLAPDTNTPAEPTPPTITTTTEDSMVRNGLK